VYFQRILLSDKKQKKLVIVRSTESCVAHLFLLPKSEYCYMRGEGLAKSLYNIYSG